MNNSILPLLASSTAATLVVGLDPVEQWILLIFFYLFLASIVSVGYFLVTVGIARSTTLRSRFFVVLLALVICRFFVSSQFVVIGIYRSLRTLQYAPSKLPVYACNFVHFWNFVGLTLEMALLQVLVLDRAVAIMRPNLYRMLNPRQAGLICVITYLVVFALKIPFAFVDVKAREVQCANSYSAPSDRFNEYTQDIDLVILCMTLFTYFVLMIYIRQKIRRLQMNNRNGRDSKQSARDSVALRRQLELMPMLRSLILLHCGLSMVTRALRFSVGWVSDPGTSARLSAYAGLFTVVDLFVNFLALLHSNKKVRKATFPCFWHGQVQSIGTVTEMKTAAQQKSIGGRVTIVEVAVFKR